MKPGAAPVATYRLQLNRDFTFTDALRLVPYLHRLGVSHVHASPLLDINDLAGIRMDKPEVFEVTHRLIRRLFASARIDGLRIDHPDGLSDPYGYFCGLQRLID